MIYLVSAADVALTSRYVSSNSCLDTVRESFVLPPTKIQNPSSVLLNDIIAMMQKLGKNG